MLRELDSNEVCLVSGGTDEPKDVFQNPDGSWTYVYDDYSAIASDSDSDGSWNYVSYFDHSGNNFDNLIVVTHNSTQPGTFYASASGTYGFALAGVTMYGTGDLVLSLGASTPGYSVETGYSAGAPGLISGDIKVVAPIGPGGLNISLLPGGDVGYTNIPDASASAVVNVNLTELNSHVNDTLQLQQSRWVNFMQPAYDRYFSPDITPDMHNQSQPKYNIDFNSNVGQDVEHQ